MKELVKLDLPFEKRNVSTDFARELFKKHRMYDKANLFKYRRGSKTNIYSLDGFDDYFYGYMPPSTGMLKYFDLHLFEDGLILQTPSSKTPKTIGEFKPMMKLFNTLKESNNWAKTMNVETIGALNDVIAEGRINDLILVQVFH